MSHASGLAAAVRGSTESDTFDLAGQNVTTITTNITMAFQEPLPISEMIRITFVTGAGKLARQKYDADAAKAVTSALRDLNFEEDRGASCIPECAGSFKLQHDTGKNLKTVVVFPRISGNGNSSNGGDGGGNANATSNGSGSSSIFPKGSPEEMIALSSMTVFESMVKSQCPSWSQKKTCMTCISTIMEQLAALEQKLLTGTPLSPTEQSFYDAVSASVMENKMERVKELMHKQVDDGHITAKEKTQLLSQVSERLEKIQSEIKEAEAAKQMKKVEKLKANALEKAQARKDKLSSIVPKQPHRLKHENEIMALRAELQPLLDLQDGKGGKLLTLKETQSLARKEEILEEIAELEQKSRGWFEDDESFAARVEACSAAWKTRSKKTTGGSAGAKKKAPAASPYASSIGANAWQTTTKTRSTATTGKKSTTAPKKPTNGRGGGVFAAMMGDSDSD